MYSKPEDNDPIEPEVNNTIENKHKHVLCMKISYSDKDGIWTMVLLHQNPTL